MAALTVFRIYFQWSQIVLGIALTIVILLQARGAGLGSVFGGTGTVFKTRRGIDRILFRGTVVIGALFALLSILTAMIPVAAAAATATGQ